MSFVLCPLSIFVKPGRGDDVIVTIDRESDSQFDSLGVGNNRKVFNEARRMALKRGNCSEPMMIAVEDVESSTLMMLTSEIITGGKKHQLAVIFNAEFEHLRADGYHAGNSFCLRMSDRLDVDGIFSERIVFSPGKNIVWNNNLFRALMQRQKV